MVLQLGPGVELRRSGSGADEAGIRALMRVSRESFKFWILILLGVVVLATVVFFVSRPRLPPYARLDAIEARFASQIERLREVALTSTGTMGGAEGIRQEERDRELFDAPAILRAQAQFSDDGWRAYGSGFDYVRGRAWFVSKPSPNRSVVNRYLYQLENGGELETLEYAGAVVRPDGSRREYKILFDMAELRSRWEAERGAEE